MEASRCLKVHTDTARRSVCCCFDTWRMQTASVNGSKEGIHSTPQRRLRDSKCTDMY
jgi:hypothetical protein